LLNHYEAPYINSGHLITSRELYDLIDGFSEHLETAEDWDFCMKARSLGAQIINNPSLIAIHYGYPTTVEAFIKRERWHGRQDVQSLRRFLESKVALIAALFLVSGILSSLEALRQLSLIPVLAYLIATFAICWILTKLKFSGATIANPLYTSVAFYLYLFGRGLSILDQIRVLIRKMMDAPSRHQ
jgi:GT2 family glycosyltransferase